MATELEDERPAGRRPAFWSNRTRIVALVAGVAAVGLGVLLDTQWRELGRAQRARASTFANAVGTADLDPAVLVDFVFLIAYGVFGVAVFLLVRDPDPPRRLHPAAMAGILLVVTGAAADLVEDVILLRALDDVKQPQDLGYMRAAGLVKWSALGAAVLALLVLLVTRAWRKLPTPSPPTTRPPGATWDPPPPEGDARVGICLSGGGVRSAAFCLGAVQALAARGIFGRARYLTAASGGGYFAAGWAVSEAGPPGDAGGNTPPRWSPGSPEERWLRDHSSYLVPNTKGGLGGVARLVAGIAVNLLVIWLVLFAVARPVGWAIHGAHPDLRAEDTALVRDGVGKMAVRQDVGTPAVIGEGNGRLERYAVNLGPAPGNDVCADVDPFDRGDRDLCFAVAQRRPATVEVKAGRARIVRQPTVRVGDRTRCEGDTCNLASPFRVEQHPQLRLTTTLVSNAAELGDALTVRRHATFRAESGLAAVEYPSYEWWMWEISLGLLAAALLVALLGTTVRVGPLGHDVLRAVAGLLAAAGAIALAVFVVLPWLVVWVPRTIGRAFGAVPEAADAESPSGSGLADYLLPGGGFLAITVAAVRQLLSGNRQGSGTGPSKPWYQRLFGRLKGASAQLRWYETSPSKIVLGVLMPVVGIVLFVGQLQYATANGVDGDLMGFAFIRDYLPWWPPEWVKELVVVGVLGALWAGVDAHAWSLYPFYKRRLSSAFMVRRTPEGPKAVDYKTFLPFAVQQVGPDGWKGLPEPGQRKVPQLVMCCAVNLSRYGVVPPGRRAASFTFSSTEIGGPVVQYATPAQYAQLPKARRRDLTVPSAMAISGAAFSPAMGKFNLGPVGALLALANLRLGVWIPNPCYVNQGQAAEKWPRLRPGWPWFLRELANKYDLGRRYVYVSDGGHWDNLGLVELLRRGCTEIYCVSCAGDGAESFGTIGEAIALAREELGVEIHLDPSPLRSPVGEPGPGRQLRREGAKDKAATFAAARTVAGTFTYTLLAGEPTGTIWYVEADLTNTMPFDVHTFAEAETIFPDDSTGDQVFNHRQFESYRRLGYHQAEVMDPP